MRLLLLCFLVAAAGCCANPYSQYPPAYSGRSPYGSGPGNYAGSPQNYRAPNYQAPPAPPSYSQSADRAPYGSPYPPPPNASTNGPTLPPAGQGYSSPSYRGADDYGWRRSDGQSSSQGYPPRWDPYSNVDPSRGGAPDYGRSYAEPFRSPNLEPLRGRGFRDTRWPF